MAKPTWNPELPRGYDGKVERGVRFCGCCGWRVVVDATFCDTCLDRAKELGGPKEASAPPRLTSEGKGRREPKNEERKKLLREIHENNARITADYIADRRTAS